VPRFTRAAEIDFRDVQLGQRAACVTGRYTDHHGKSATVPGPNAASHRRASSNWAASAGGMGQPTRHAADYPTVCGE
jgi:hypothetical protein